MPGAPDRDSGPRLTPGEEARTLLAATNVATLATLSDDGAPWGSLVAVAALGDGAPVLCLSRLAEHGRNLKRDPRASLVVAEEGRPANPLAAGRVTLAGRARRPDDPDALAAARAVYLAAVPEAAAYVDFADFSLWVLTVERARWVGGYGSMASCSAAEYAASAPDPIVPAAGGAVAHLNADHADALLVIAQELGGRPDATVARCRRIDRHGLDLELDTPEGHGVARVAFATELTAPAELRAASVELARRARAHADAGRDGV